MVILSPSRKRVAPCSNWTAYGNSEVAGVSGFWAGVAGDSSFEPARASFFVVWTNDGKTRNASRATTNIDLVETRGANRLSRIISILAFSERECRNGLAGSSRAPTCDAFSDSAVLSTTSA